MGATHGQGHPGGPVFFISEMGDNLAYLKANANDKSGSGHL